MIEKTDTNPLIVEKLIKGYRQMSPARKLSIALEMSEMLIELANIGIEKRYPGISSEEKRKRLGALLLGRELSIKLNKWDPEAEGY